MPLKFGQRATFATSAIQVPNTMVEHITAIAAARSTCLKGSNADSERVVSAPLDYDRDAAIENRSVYSNIIFVLFNYQNITVVLFTVKSTRTRVPCTILYVHVV